MADCSKYPRTAHLFFFVYDPDLQIRDVKAFRETVHVYLPIMWPGQDTFPDRAELQKPWSTSS